MIIVFQSNKLIRLYKRIVINKTISINSTAESLFDSFHDQLYLFNLTKYN